MCPTKGVTFAAESRKGMKTPQEQHINHENYEALRQDRDRWADIAMEQQQYIRHLEEQIINLQKQLKMKDQQSTGGTTINVQGNYIAEQNNDIHDCTIFASGITPGTSSRQTGGVASAEKGNEDTPENNYPFVVLSKLAELGTYTDEEFETVYRQAAAQGAPKFAKFLKHYNGLGVLDFDDNDKKQIFEILKAFFPTEIKYGYTNFTIYF